MEGGGFMNLWLCLLAGDGASSLHLPHCCASSLLLLPGLGTMGTSHLGQNVASAPLALWAAM